MTYPREDYPTALERLVPVVVATGRAWLYAVELFRPVADLDLLVAGIYDSFISIEAASGWLLDLRGATIGEERGGLDDQEFARIIAAREIAIYGGCGAESVWAVWVALTGDEGGTYDVYPGGGCVRLVATMPFIPSTSFRRRARDVLNTALPADADAYAVLRVPGGLAWDDPLYTWGYGLWSAAI